MSGTLMSLLIVESVLTAAAITMFVYRSMLDLKEEDQIVLHDSEAHLAREQDTIRQKVNMLTRYIRVVSVLWGGLAVVIFAR